MVRLMPFLFARSDGGIHGCFLFRHPRHKSLPVLSFSQCGDGRTWGNESSDPSGILILPSLLPFHSGEHPSDTKCRKSGYFTWQGMGNMEVYTIIRSAYRLSGWKCLKIDRGRGLWIIIPDRQRPVANFHRASPAGFGRSREWRL